MNITDPLELLQLIVDRGTAEPILIDHAHDLLRGWRDRGDYAEIPLTGGVWAKISNEDIPRVLNHKWFCIGKVDCRTNPAHPRAKIGGRAIPLGRFILGLPVGDERRADHINYDNLDNRRENLRIVTKQQSALHRRGWHRRAGETRSKFKGVYLGRKNHERPWRAVIKVDGKPLQLGYFASEEEAARAYDRASLEHHQEFGETNFGPQF